ncbi:MAG: motif family protein [Acidobacteriota bacterium]|jgi:Spy/CpxP family protein refolding chaperone|nr:motif family protein [Acidobacteriota bacterium]
MKEQFLKRTTLMLALFFVVGLGLASRRVAAQIPGEPMQPPPQQGNQEPNWKEQLGLSEEQMGKIRSIREQNRVDGQAIRRRVNLAQRALDQAIYSDAVNETEVEQRARELAAAQAAEVRLRAMTELNIRRVLTAEQLTTFRAIRLQRMRDAQMRRRENAEEGGPAGSRRLENGLGTPPKRERDQGRPGEVRQGNGTINPALIPRRANLPRRIRP